MRYEDVAELLPRLLDGDESIDAATLAFIESDLRCQAELARYRKLLRTLQLLRTRYLEPSPGLLAQTLAALEEAGERRALRSVLTGRRIAYGAIGGAAVAGAAATAVLVARSRRRSGLRLAG
jgi:hypothetical protein